MWTWFEQQPCRRSITRVTNLRLRAQFLGTQQMPNNLLINDGSGGLTSAGMVSLTSGSEDALSAVFADIDGDGDVDLVRLIRQPAHTLSAAPLTPCLHAAVRGQLWVS